MSIRAKNTAILLSIPLVSSSNSKYEPGTYKKLMSGAKRGLYDFLMIKQLGITIEDIDRVEKQLDDKYSLPMHEPQNSISILSWIQSAINENERIQNYLELVRDDPLAHSKWVDYAETYYTKIFGLESYDQMNLRTNLLTMTMKPQILQIPQMSLDITSRQNIAMLIAYNFLNLPDDASDVAVKFALMSVVNATGKIYVDYESADRFTTELKAEVLDHYGGITVRYILDMIASIIDSNPDVKAYLMSIRNDQDSWEKWLNDTVGKYGGGDGLTEYLKLNMNDSRILRTELVKLIDQRL